jgi:NADPH-dependent 2,4-dienoyl-CoA reductase/sulfur reductase-like enzyme
VPERLVVIGGDAGGMTAATQARRCRDDLEIVALEKGMRTSYSACGIPYLVAGDLDDIDVLVARSPQEHRDRSRIDVRTQQEAMAIDVDGRQVEVRDHEHGRTYRLPFDHLVVATGARPLRPSLPGIDLEAVRGVQTLEDAAELLAQAERIKPEQVVVVGGGYIGLEMAEAFVRRGASVVLVEAEDQVMRTLDPDMAELIHRSMTEFGIDVRTKTAVEGFEPGVVHTAPGPVDADLVILGMGVVPNSELAGEAGLDLGTRGAISVNRRQETSAEGVWAAGDCCESFHLVSRRRLHIALGTVANKQGRVAGINIGGGYATFPGVVGTAVTKVCSTEVARTGLNVQEAIRDGFVYEAVTVRTTTRAGYFPGAKELVVKVLAERESGRLLGAQIVGEEGAAKRIDVFATALTNRMTVHDMIDLDLSYAPPFSPLWDAVLIAARKASEQIVRTR